MSGPLAYFGVGVLVFSILILVSYFVFNLISSQRKLESALEREKEIRQQVDRELTMKTQEPKVIYYEQPSPIPFYFPIGRYGGYRRRRWH